MVEQIEELTLLMNDLIDLARGEEPRSGRRGRAPGPARRRGRSSALAGARPARRCSSTLEPTVVAGVPARLERAVGNLIDNAVKYSPPGEPVEISLHGDELTVRDHGPGISAEDLPHVFDRFYRGAEARGRPGSGLGLAIVRQVAVQQGGSVAAEPAAGGGTLMRLLPARRGVRRRRRPGAGASDRAALRSHLVVTRALAEARRREAVAAAERAREVRRLAVADQARDVAHGDRRAARAAGRRQPPSAARADPRWNVCSPNCA